MPILLVLRSMRPRQWTKNLVVFAAIIFSLNLGDRSLLLDTFGAFLAFCLISGSVYLMNDLKDREADRAHPRKKSRPIASGELSPGAAMGAIAALLLLGGATAWSLGISVVGVTAAYFVLNVFYSFALKDMVLLDVMAIASGFVLRAIAGARVLHEAGQPTEISVWLLMCTFFLSLFLGLGKRRHELVHQGSTSRASLNSYSLDLVDRLTSITVAVTVLSYSIYTIWPTTIEHFGTDRLVYTIPLVFYGLSRYLYLTLEEDKGGDPSEMLLTDRSILATVVVWLAVVAWILYAAD